MRIAAADGFRDLRQPLLTNPLTLRTDWLLVRTPLPIRAWTPAESGSIRAAWIPNRTTTTKLWWATAFAVGGGRPTSLGMRR